MIVLERPLFLILLVVVGILMYLRHFWIQRGQRLPFSHDAIQISFKPPRVFAGALLLLAHGAHWLAWIVLIVALSAPHLIHQEKVFLSKGLDIMIALDESPSMAAQDTQSLSRFATAKTVIRDFVLQRENDAVGLVSFSSEGFLRVPPTLDYDYFIDVLQGLEIMDIEDGTAIGMGLLLAALHLSSSDTPEKVIILLTDGVNTTGEITPIAAVELATKLNIRIYTIGIGSRQETLLEYQDLETGTLFRGTVRNSFDEALLSEIATVSGAAYFGVSDFESLQTVFDAIDSAERLEQRLRIDVKSTPVHRYFIICMLGFFSLDLTIRKLLLREGGI